MRPLTVFLMIGLYSVRPVHRGQPPAAPPADVSRFNAQLLYSATLAGDWLVNNQEKRQIYGEPYSADYGRWLYEYKTREQSWRGSTCWTASTGIMGLALLYERTGLPKYKEAIERASLYLKSLQILDPRVPRNYGALREHTPMDDFIFPRDGATGMGGLLALYRFTGDKEYLERARFFGDWYLNEAFNPATRWPYYTFPFNPAKVDPTDRRAGAWQAGAGIFFYQLYRLTRNRVYLDKAVLPMAEGLVGNALGDAGLLQTKGNNDDFATFTLLGAFRETGDKRYWDTAVKRLEQLMSLQREDGAMVPGNTGGMYIAMMTALDALQLAAEKNLPIDKERLDRFVRRATGFALSLQETKPDDVKTFGGFYGQTDLQNFRREWIHARGTTYSVIFNLRYEGVVKVPFYSIFGWD